MKVGLFSFLYFRKQSMWPELARYGVNEVSLGQLLELSEHHAQ
jgi:hypothetical protein